MRQGSADVFHAQRHVMNAWLPPGDVGRDRRVGRSGLEQLQPGLTYRDGMHAHTFACHFFRGVHVQAQALAVEGERFLDVLDRNADVVEDSLHRSDAGEPGSVRDSALGVRDRGSMRFMISSAIEYGSRVLSLTASTKRSKSSAGSARSTCRKNESASTSRMCDRWRWRFDAFR